MLTAGRRARGEQICFLPKAAFVIQNTVLTEPEDHLSMIQQQLLNNDHTKYMTYQTRYLHFVEYAYPRPPRSRKSYRERIKYLLTLWANISLTPLHSAQMNLYFNETAEYLPVWPVKSS
jgi:hypothetical protein